MYLVCFVSFLFRLHRSSFLDKIRFVIHVVEFSLLHVLEHISKRLISIDEIRLICYIFSPAALFQLSNMSAVLLELFKGIGSDDILVYPAFQLHFTIVHRFKVLACKSNQHRSSRINSQKAIGKVLILYGFNF